MIQAIGKSHFVNDFKKIGNNGLISSWKSKGFSDEIIKPHSTLDNSPASALSYIGNKTRIIFEGRCLNQDKIIFTHGKTMSRYIVYEISLELCRQ